MLSVCNALLARSAMIQTGAILGWSLVRTCIRKRGLHPTDLIALVMLHASAGDRCSLAVMRMVGTGDMCPVQQQHCCHLSAIAEALAVHINV
jgi:hypothetical protein